MSIKPEIEAILPSKVVESLAKKEKLHIIDVREHNEVALGKIPGAKHISLGEVLTRLDELDKDKEYIMVCRSGKRSGLASEWLTDKGFKVKNMTGGMNDWKSETE
ncbi:rhodanese-like domain-containing protein [Terribacillus saccharophilus]|uniref:Sulfurtransferase n=1 Tax=Terribacillus saccharophilus TaxID=361277 RepID=A0ABX4H2R7_9BACI|nr:rhodanese-like domain-containing protein [Terribacillus saccharophilus]PAD37145.1 sulfurtransferase [Terribacillus saccharophilus]PAD97389.1 sulfurtransferase [Terribacillus saccharophilus]PAE01437.1 sulfurtransferase [Terribacillus saccharophilus]